MQSIFTRHYGEIRFIRTWAQVGGLHIGIMPNGAYAHIGGLPVTNAADLQAAIPAGVELDRAMAWFENRGKVRIDANPVRKVYFDPDDGSWRYIDSHQVVDDAGDLLAALKGGPLGDALAWFQTHQSARMPGAPVVPQAQSPQERFLGVLRDDPGQSVQMMAKILGFDLKATAELAQALRDEGQITVMGKMFYLPSDLEPAEEGR